MTTEIVRHDFTLYRPGLPPQEGKLMLPGRWPGFREIEAPVKALLECEHIERVRVWRNETEEYTDMFVDEDFGAKGLPVNLTATALYQANIRRWRPNEVSDNLPEIHGPAVLFWKDIWS